MKYLRPSAFLAFVILLFSPGDARAGALQLDGIDDIVTFPGTGIPSGANPFTIEVWINPTSIPSGGENGGQMTFWGNQTGNQANGFRLRGPSGTRHFFWGNDHDENFGISLLPDTTGPNGDGWHHLAITFSGSQTRWYWNGAPLGSPRTAAGVNVAAVNHRIGSRLSAEFFHGFMDELRIWNVARSQADLSANMGVALNGDEAGLVAYWDFEGDLVDRAGGNNNGVGVGGAQVNAGVSAPIVTSGPRITSFTALPGVVHEAETLTLSWEVDVTDVTGSLTVEILGEGGAVLLTTSAATGSHPVVIGDRAGVALAVVYTLRAGESGGGLVTREEMAVVDVLPGIPVADPQPGLSTVATAPLAVVLTGSDPNMHPNPGLTFSIETQPAGGVLSGTAPNVSYVANPGFSGPDTFTFLVNDGKYDSIPATVGINVVALPEPPSDILLSSSSIPETVGLGGFIASFDSVDANPEESHSYMLVPGVGDVDNGLFAIDGNQLQAGADFGGQVGGMYSIRVRSLDSGGMSLEKSFVLTVIEVSGELVINEIHYNPPENPVRQEFIEIYNPGNAVADLTGWRLSGGVDYLFPNGTVVVAGGYLVVGEDPATLLATFGVAALGPYEGNLNAEGENVRLRDGADEIVDEVDYSVGFPWPVDPDGSGASMELIHPLLNNSHGSSWRASLVPGGPTPGAVNSVLAENAPPSIRQVNHSPKSPGSGEMTVITARVTDPDFVGSVGLEYQVVAPGVYVPSKLARNVSGGRIQGFPAERLDNPAYEANWIGVGMNDSGVGGDEVAGDDIYTVVLPVQPHRTLVRYRITVEDAVGNAARVPYPDDERLNFAYFVYDGVPDYNGHSAETLTRLPVYHVITSPADWSECLAWSSGDQITQGGEDRFAYNWNGCIVYDGEVYDNITYRLRGANGRYHQAGKRSMRFRFNDGDFFQARDQEGNPFPAKWRTLTTTKGFENRGTLTYALNEAINMYLWNQIGLPAQETFWIHFRVIDGAAEAPDRWRGDFWGLNFVVETYDVLFMERVGLEKGNLYKLINQTTDWLQQQRYQSAFGALNGDDHDTIEGALTGNSTADFVRAHVNLEKYYLYHGLSEAVRNYDFWPSANKNMVYYFAPVYTPENNGRGQLWILPWDSDATWGPTWNSGHDVVYNSIFPTTGGGSDGASNPELWPGYYNTVRELRDLVWQEDQLNAVIDDFASIIAPMIPADSDRWKGAPADAGTYGSLAGAGIVSLENLVNDLKNFAFVGGSWPGGDVGAGGRAAHLDSLDGVRGESSQIPVTPSISYVGPPGFPVDGLFLRSSAFSDPQGLGSFGAMEWRVAAVHNTNAPGYVRSGRPALEWVARWESGELSPFSDTIHVPASAVEPGVAYRARVRHRDNTGRWSHWSGPLAFTLVGRDLFADLQSGLVISEIMYNPPDSGGYGSDDLEWLELKNEGGTELDLGGLFFSEGIEFVFPHGTMLAPGALMVLVRDPGAFGAQHPGVGVGGVYDGRLANGGETLTIEHPHGVTILSFSFNDRAPFPAAADGFGFSLVRDPGTGAYRGSSEAGGSPGADDPPNSVPGILVTEISSASDLPALDAIELFNPGGEAVDIGGWFLTDDPGVPKQFRIPDGTLIAAGGYLVFDEDDFNDPPGVGTAFSLSSAGERVYLFSGVVGSELTGYSHGFVYGGSARNATFGRYVNSVGEEQLPAQIEPTLGLPNSGPLVGPVVMSEIHYNAGLEGMAFVELQNVSGSAVPLFDPAAPTNTWRLDGVGFDFPGGVILEPGAFCLIVETDPAVFRAVHGLPAAVQIFGPYLGGLQDSGERLELQRTAAPGTGVLYYYSVDGVGYDDNAPWPAAADGGGASLQRRDPAAYGDDPINWDAAVPTPGAGLPVGAAPVITVQPVDLVAVALSDSSLTVTAGGPGPLSYQWMRNGNNLAGGNAATFVISNALPGDAGIYSVAVYNPFGSVVSEEVVVTVEIPATITQHPRHFTVFPGTNITFTVRAESSSLISYQWRRNGIPLLGETNSSLVLNDVQVWDEGEYTVVVTDGVGPVESLGGVLVVLVAPAFVVNPKPAEVALGGTLVLSAQTTGTLPMGYRWRRGGGALLIEESVDRSYSILVVTNVTAAHQGSYTVVATNEASHRPGVISMAVAVTIAADADGDLMPDGYEVANGLDQNDPSDAGGDADGDGSTNREEYVAGTDPNDGDDFLKIEAITAAGGVEIQYRAVAGVTYTVQWSGGVNGPWNKLKDVPGQAGDGLLMVLDPGPVAVERYYRVVTPVQP